MDFLCPDSYYSHFLGLRNDLSSVMKEIEEGLYKAHALARENKTSMKIEGMDTSNGDSRLTFHYAPSMIFLLLILWSSIQIFSVSPSARILLTERGIEKITHLNKPGNLFIQIIWIDFLIPVLSQVYFSILYRDG